MFPCDPELTEAMDIFSAGCVIAEVFLDGDPLFDQSQLLQYRAAEESKKAARSRGLALSVPDFEPPALTKITDARVQVCTFACSCRHLGVSVFVGLRQYCEVPKFCTH